VIRASFLDFLGLEKEKKGREEGERKFGKVRKKKKKLVPFLDNFFFLLLLLLLPQQPAKG